ncbi:MAG: isoprenyl transferase [Labrys sp. (in: a-proteobacteria)]|jgi:undecaprenyl diphosphate synthase
MAEGLNMVQHAVPASPRHVAIIMDGNGRWATRRGLPRLEGHRRGVEALRRTVRAAGEMGVSFLTVYAFSSENWSRPRIEIDGLMGLLKRFIRNDLVELHENNIRIRVIGEREGLEPDVLGLLTEAETLTRNNTALTLVIAFNYGSRQEMTRAVQAVAAGVKGGTIDPATITPALIAGFLDTAGIPDPDLVIRTSGEMRLSNFLLWQAAYAEFVFSPVLWPDFDRAAFEAALREFAARDRRFGGVDAAAYVQQSAR